MPADLVSPTFPSARNVRAVLSWLKAQPDLQPSPSVNRVFNRLVAIARSPSTNTNATTLLAELQTSRELERLHALCAEGETALEYAWSARLRQSTNPAADLAEFPYLDEYRKLAAKEVRFLRQTRPHARHVLFVGSGPLPLTSWLMADHHGLRVDMLDINPHAHTCAMGWLHKLPGHKNLRCLHADILHLNNLGEYDAVFLAAMVGRNTAEKQQVLNHLARTMRLGQPLIARSTHGLRQLLYPQLNLSTSNGFKLVKASHPTGKVVNSILLAVRQ